MNRPVIETIEQAIDIGFALHWVLRFDIGWAERVFQGRGAAELNQAIQEHWAGMSDDQRSEILAHYVAARLSR